MHERFDYLLLIVLPIHILNVQYLRPFRNQSHDVLEVQKFFLQHMLKYLPEKIKVLLEEIEKEDCLKNYKIEVHALKGTAATVGALLLSKVARLLEVAAAEKNIEKIKVLHPILLEEIQKHKERVSTLFIEKKQEIDNKELIESYLNMLNMGLMQEDYDTADFIIGEINKYQYTDEMQLLVDELAGQILNMETSVAIETVEKIKNIL